jgi:hypothetical protein
MAARVRASLTDDDSISDHIALEMVRINAPQTTSTIPNNDPDEQITLNESTGTIGGHTPATNDFLLTSNPCLVEGINREYEIPNLFTFKKVIFKKLNNHILLNIIYRSNHCLKECKMKIPVYL